MLLCGCVAAVVAVLIVVAVVAFATNCDWIAVLIIIATCVIDVKMALLMSFPLPVSYDRESLCFSVPLTVSHEVL